ncbi:MAG: DUF4062 domain-containing protein [Schlesneria sp.]
MKRLTGIRHFSLKASSAAVLTMKLYLSSTYLDLEHHREVLGRTLRKSGYEVAMIEEYVARDQRVEIACMGDVVECDVYLGVFAWRYGHIPSENNPERLSVTEMEYVAAGGKPMTRLTFLLKDKTSWPEQWKDPDLTRISNLRARLQNQCSGYFETAEDLAKEVLCSLRVHESTRKVQQLEAADIVLKSQKLDDSYLMSIRDKLGLLGTAQFIELQTGPIPWWNTRLYLVAALARDAGRTRGLVFVDNEGKFLLMTSPFEICHRLELKWPALNQAYAKFRSAVSAFENISNELKRYPEFVSEAFGQNEESAKHSLTVRDFEYDLGIARDAEIVDIRNKRQQFLLREILGRTTPYVALVRDHQLEGIVDRQLLAQRVAQAALE